MAVLVLDVIVKLVGIHCIKNTMLNNMLKLQ